MRNNKQPIKIEINFSQVDSESEPRLVETARHGLAIKDQDKDEDSAENNQNMEGLSTKGNDVSRRETSGDENLTLNANSQDEQGFSQAAEHSNHSLSPQQ